MPKPGDSKRIKSEYTGVSWHTVGRFWVAQLKTNGTSYYLGKYTDERVAATIYNIANYLKRLKNKTLHELKIDSNFGTSVTTDEANKLFIGSIGPIPDEILNKVRNMLMPEGYGYKDNNLDKDDIAKLTKLFPDSLKQTEVSQEYNAAFKPISKNKRANVTTPSLATRPKEDILELTEDDIDYLIEALEDKKEDKQDNSELDLLVESLFGKDSEVDIDEMLKAFNVEDEAVKPQPNLDYSIRTTNLGDGYKVCSVTINGKYYPLGASYNIIDKDAEDFATKFIKYVQDNLSVYGLIKTSYDKPTDDRLINKFRAILNMEHEKPDTWAKAVDKMHWIENPNISEDEKHAFAQHLAATRPGVEHQTSTNPEKSPNNPKRMKY